MDSLKHLNEFRSWIGEIKPFYFIELNPYHSFLSVACTLLHRRATPSNVILLKEKMTRPLRLVAVSGGLQRPSRSAALAEHLLDLLADEVPCEQRLIELGLFAPQLAGAVWRSELPDPVERALAAVEQADVLVVATPVFRGAYTGLFKHFFDFIHQDALIDKPVLLAATGGSERHALVIDHQLRPLFSFFQARTLPLGVYATDADFVDYRLQNEALIERARLAVQRALPLVELMRRATPSPTADMVLT